VALVEHDWLEQFYDRYPRVEHDFLTVLDMSLQPRGPELLYDLVQAFGLPAGSTAVDVGCGEGRHSLELAERFGLRVVGLDPVPRHLELAQAALDALIAASPKLAGSVRFEPGSAEKLPIEDATTDLVWCRDVLMHVEDLDGAYAEMARVLRPGGRALVYHTFAGDRLDVGEAEWLWRTMGIVPTSADRAGTETAITAAGLRIDDRIDLGGEWGEWADERSAGRHLLRASRLLRDPDRYIAQFGHAAYQIMLGDCLWHVYGMIGKLSPAVYLLSRR
jgi:SAM-dependent methyltransferase